MDDNFKALKEKKKINLRCYVQQKYTSRMKAA